MLQTGVTEEIKLISKTWDLTSRLALASGWTYLLLAKLVLYIKCHSISYSEL